MGKLNRSWKLPVISAWTILILMFCGIQTIVARYPDSGFDDLPGDYCRTRWPQQCCDDRKDECSLPVLGTLCYCDTFCDRNENPDCCPDYWEVCKGRTPPTTTTTTPRPRTTTPTTTRPQPIRNCYKDGYYIRHGETYKINCNTCECNDGKHICEDDPCMIEERVIREVNSAPLEFRWTASNYSEYWGRKASEGLVLKTGTLDPDELSLRMFPITLITDKSQIPIEFDARGKWQSRISEVQDQGWCGASWAFSTVGVAEDRLRIASTTNENVKMSAQNLLSCTGQISCEGGNVDAAWNYLRRIGVANEKCYPYVSGVTGSIPTCLIPRRGSVFDLQCLDQVVPYQREDLYKTEPAYRIKSREEDIQWEIMNTGPVQAMIEINSDLFMYRSGIYSRSGLMSETASHSVRIIGWGEDRTPGYNTVKYWLVANSWGKQWGEDGHFRIRRGTNESEIENFIIAVRAQLGPNAVRIARQRQQRIDQALRRSSRNIPNYYKHHLHSNKKY